MRTALVVLESAEERAEICSIRLGRCLEALDRMMTSDPIEPILGRAVNDCSVANLVIRRGGI